MNNCKQNDCGWCYDRSGMSNDTNGACLAPAECAVNNWPTETAIDNTGMNGEVDTPTYRIGDTLYRINPVGSYALYWSGKKWQESQNVTNRTVMTAGVLEK